MFLVFFLTLKVSVAFSPGCQDKIVEYIDSATKEVLVAVYILTSREISRALAKARTRGVDVKVIIDGELGMSKFSKAKYLAKRGVKVRLLRYPLGGRFRPKMHHKFMIVDKKIVSTGSFNFTASAEKLNDENCLFIELEKNAGADENEVVEKFMKEFERLWKISSPP